MAEKRWEPEVKQFCDHVGCDVVLEVEVVYPADFMPDQPPRLLSRRCSRGLECNMWKNMTCIWAGTNPLIDPFRK